MDLLYPLYGNLVLQPDQPLAEATAFDNGHWGVAIDPVLAERLEVSIGDDVYIGSLTMRVRALVMQQPDRSLSAEWRGAPVLLSAEALAASGLTGAGSRIDFNYRVRTAVPTRYVAKSSSTMPFPTRPGKSARSRVAVVVSQSVLGSSRPG